MVESDLSTVHSSRFTRHGLCAGELFQHPTKGNQKPGCRNLFTTKLSHDREVSRLRDCFFYNTESSLSPRKARWRFLDRIQRELVEGLGPRVRAGRSKREEPIRV